MRANGQVRRTEISGIEKQFPIGLCVLVFVRCIEILGIRNRRTKSTENL